MNTMTTTPTTTVRAALYARVSSDKQREESLDDQFRVCERLCERERFTVADRHSDLFISGGTASRPAYQALLAGARRREYDVIIAEDLKRLWREQAEQWRALKELIDLGIHVVTVSGIDSRQQNFELLASVIGAASELDRKEIAYRTHRGLEGRARAGKATGGKAYGYDSKRNIVATEAAIVREIFASYADGASMKRIVADLNVRRVPSPGASWGRKSRRRDGCWLVSTLHSLLRNEAYIGRLVWNKVRWVRSAADSKKRKPVKRPESEWIVNEVPALAIITRETWDRVQARLQTHAKTVKPGGQIKYLLSGVLVCSCCRGNMVVTGTKPRRYICSSFHHGGPAACANRLSVSVKLAERLLLARVKSDLLAPARIKHAVQGIRKMAVAEAKVQAREVDNPEVGRISVQIAKLDALKRDGVEGLDTALAKARADLAALPATLTAAPRRIDVERIAAQAEAAYRFVIEKLEQVLAGSEEEHARSVFRRALGTIAVAPDEGRLVAVYRQPTGEVIAQILDEAGHTALVAGAGFEPATFGL